MSRIKAKGLVVFVVLAIFIGCGKREERLLSKADEYRFNYNFDESIIFYKKVLDANPESVKANFGLISATFSKENKADADRLMREYEVKTEMDPKNGLWFYCLGLSMFLKKEYDEALTQYMEALELGFDSARCYSEIGRVFYKKNMLNEAIDRLRKAIELNPKYASPYYLLGQVYTQKKLYDNALPMFEKYLELEPKDYDGYLQVGLTYEDKNMLDNAIKFYKKAAKLGAKDERCWYFLGTAYKKKELYDKAIDCFEKGLRENPKAANLYTSLGLIYEKKSMLFYFAGRRALIDKAVSFYNESIKADPKYVPAYVYLSQLLIGKNNYEDAVVLLKKALELAPGDHRLYFSIGEVFFLKKSYDQAIEAFEKALSLGTSLEAQTYKLLGIAYYNKGYYDKAVFCFENTLKVTSEDTEIRQLAYNARILQKYQGKSEKELEKIAIKKIRNYTDEKGETVDANYKKLLEAAKKILDAFGLGEFSKNEYYEWKARRKYPNELVYVVEAQQMVGPGDSFLDRYSTAQVLSDDRRLRLNFYPIKVARNLGNYRSFGINGSFTKPIVFNIDLGTEKIVFVCEDEEIERDGVVVFGIPYKKGGL